MLKNLKPESFLTKLSQTKLKANKKQKIDNIFREFDSRGKKENVPAVVMITTIDIINIKRLQRTLNL